MSVSTKCRPLLIAATLSFFFHVSPAQAQCSGGETTAACLASITETEIKKKPEADHGLRMQALSALIRYYREKNDPLADTFLAQIYGESVTGDINLLNDVVISELAYSFLRGGEQHVKNSLKEFNLLSSRIKAPEKKIAKYCGAVYQRLLEMQNAGAARNFKEAAGCDPKETATIDISVAISRADYISAFDTAEAAGLHDVFASMLTVAAKETQAVLVDGKLVWDQPYKHKHMLAALPRLRDAGSRAGVTYIRDLLVAFLEFGDVESAMSLNKQLTETTRAAFAVFIGRKYLEQENYNKAAELLEENLLQDENYQFMMGYLASLYKNIDDQDLLRLVIKASKNNPHAAASIVAKMAEDKGTAYLDKLDASACKKKWGNFASKSLYECLSDNVHEADWFTRAKLDVAFGKYRKAAKQFPSDKDDGLLVYMGVRTYTPRHSDQVKNGPSIAKIIGLALAASDCDIQRIRSTFEPDTENLSTVLRRTEDENETWDLMRVACVVRKGRGDALFAQSALEKRTAVAQSIIKSYEIGSPDPKAIRDASGGAPSLELLKLLRYVSDDGQKLRMLRLAVTQMSNIREEEKETLVQSLKSAYGLFAPGISRDQAVKEVFLKVLTVDFIEALEIRQKNTSLQQDLSVAKILKNEIVKRGHQDMVMQVFYALSATARKNHLLEFFRGQIEVYEANVNKVSGDYIKIAADELPENSDARIAAATYLLARKIQFPPLLSYREGSPTNPSFACGVGSFID
ncbi:MAG: hypothetical protein PSY14_05940 [bacterium]|nr:hypothetical protein [bacterium]